MDEDFIEIVVCLMYYSKYIYIYHEFNNSCLIIIEITVIWCRKNGYYCGELFLSSPM